MKKRLVEGGGAGYTIKMQEVNVKTAKVALDNDMWKIKGQCEFVGSAEGYDWISQKKDYVGDFELEVYQNELVGYFKKYYPDTNIETITQISNKLNYDFDYSVDDIKEVLGAGWSHVEWNGRLELEHAAFDIDNYSGDFVIFDKGRDGDNDINDCSFAIECKEFAMDVENAYQNMYDSDGEDYMKESKGRKMTMTLGQFRRLLKESSKDGQLSIQNFKVGDKVEWRDLVVNKEQWLDGVVTDVNPRSGLTIEFPHHPIMNPVRIPAKYIDSNNLRLVKEDKDDYDKMDRGLDDYWESFNPDEIQWEPYDGHKLIFGAIYLVAFKDKDDGLGVYAFRYDSKDKLRWQSDLHILGQEVY